MEIQATLKNQKVLKPYTENSVVKENVVYIDTTQRYFKIVYKISDINKEIGLKYEKLFRCVQNRKLFSDYCAANSTSVVELQGSVFITNNSELLVYLYSINFRSEKMKKIESQQNLDSLKIQTVSQYDDEYKKYSNLLSTAGFMYTEEKIESVLRQYLGKFGDIYFFGHGERVFINYFLLPQQEAPLG